jgi:hypothetical protein
MIAINPTGINDKHSLEPRSGLCFLRNRSEIT